MDGPLGFSSRSFSVVVVANCIGGSRQQFLTNEEIQPAEKEHSLSVQSITATMISLLLSSFRARAAKLIIYSSFGSVAMPQRKHSGVHKAQRNKAHEARMRKIREKTKKKFARKRVAKKPSWVAAVQKRALENVAIDGIEVQGDLAPEVQERLNNLYPLQTQMFLTNLSQDTGEDYLREYFSQFGDVKRVLRVRNKATALPTSSAFVHFSTPSAAESVFTFAQNNARELNATLRRDSQQQVEGMSRHQAKKLQHKLSAAWNAKHDPFIEMQSIRIGVHRVLSRSDAQEFVASTVKKKKTTRVAADDPRNLYLLQEGMIVEGSAASRGLPPDYLRMLLQDYEIRKVQLRDVNKFVSKDRLSFRNVPRNVTTQQLRKLCQKEVRKFYARYPERQAIDKQQWGKHGPIVGAKILMSASGVSKGYGFVEFASHDVALHVLRILNNNPTIFGPNRRLMVSFSIEDSNALQRHQRRKEMRASLMGNKRQREDAAAERSEQQTSAESKPCDCP